MNSSKHNIFRKLIAGGLLALLVFVYAEKFSHTHHNAGSKELAGYSATATNATCAICDFTLAKDAELPEPYCITVPFKIIQQHYLTVTTHYCFLPERFISNKGPPAC